MATVLDLPEPDVIERPTSRRPSRRRQRRRAAWQAMAWGVAAFALLQAMLALAAETWLPALRDPTFWSKVPRFRERVEAAPTRPLTVVMFGSSCTVFGFRGQILEEDVAPSAGRPVVAYNFGYYGRGPLTTQVNLQRLLREGLRPDLVLIEIFPIVLSEKIPDTDKQGALMQRADLATVAPYRETVVYDWLRATFLPVSANRTALLSALSPRLLLWNECPEWWREIDASGWRYPQGEARSPTPEFAEKITKDWTKKLGRYQPGGEGIKALDELLALGKRENVPMALVVMPEGSILRDLYPAEKYETTRRHVSDLAARYAVPLVDARAWLDEEDFMDSHHQLAHGAAKFTARLSREFVAPFLRKQVAPSPAAESVE